MIISINFSLFPSDELFTFSKGVLTIVDEKKEQATALIPFFDKAAQALELYQSSLERERKNPFTLILAEKNGQRDDAFMAFRSYTKAASYRKNADWNTAASKILEVIRHHAWSATGLGYKAETAALTNIISEVRNKYGSEVTLIGAADWLDELDAAEKAFDTVFHQSIIATPTDEPGIWDIRPLLTNSLKALLSMISLLHSNAPEPVLATLETSLNELIVRSLATVKASNTRADHRKKEDNLTKV